MCPSVLFTKIWKFRDVDESQLPANLTAGTRTQILEANNYFNGTYSPKEPPGFINECSVPDKRGGLRSKIKVDGKLEKIRREPELLTASNSSLTL